jgi:DNA-binding LacI/PurR family transcriptional regulator
MKKTANTIIDNSNDDIKLVESYLLDAVRSQEVGSRLPSIRQIRQNCKVGQSIIDRAIENLRRENILEVRARAGLYRTSQQFLPEIKILYFGDLDSLFKPQRGYFYYVMVSQLLFQLSDTERKTKIIKSPGSISSEIYDSLIKSRPCTLVTVSLKEADVEIFNELSRRGYTVLHLIPDFQEKLPGSMNIDDTELINLQVEYLVKHGHKQIAYFHCTHPDRWSRAENMRFTAYYQCAMEHGIELRKEYIVQVDSSAVGEMQRTQQAAYDLAKLEDPPTAIILCSDNHARPTYRGLRASGMEPGRDIAVVGTNNMGICDSYDPSLSSVGFDIENSLNKFHDMIVGAEAGKIISPKKMISKFFERESTLWYKK